MRRRPRNKGLAESHRAWIGHRRIPAKRHGGTRVTETPLPASHQGVGRRPPGVAPAICEPATPAGTGGGHAWTLLGVPRARLRPRLRGPLGPWQGTDDFLGFVRTGGRVSLPNGNSPMALIHKGGWCGSESIRRLPNEKRRRVCGDGTALRGMTERVSGHEKIGRANDRGQLNGGPFPHQLGADGAGGALR
jgi:hypothetical protein